MILRVKDKDGNIVEIPVIRGPQGVGIRAMERTGGDGSPGTTDTYTITMSDGSTATITVYNGRDGTGSGDMTADAYDPQGKKTDIFKYVDDQIGDIAAVLDSINGEVV